MTFEEWLIDRNITDLSPVTKAIALNAWESAMNTAAKMRQPTETAQDVAVLLEALKDIASTFHYSASAGVYFANRARKALAAYHKQEVGLCE